GGTKIAAGLVDGSGQIIRQARVPMNATGDAQSGVECVKRAIAEVLPAGTGKAGPLAGIGICCPGPLDSYSGTVLNPPNLPCWRNFPLASAIESTLGLPVRLDNDANAAALAEATWGAGIGYRNVFYTTLGTGVGTGIVFDGEIYHGRTGSAAEGGHVSIDYQGLPCACGKRGCIEAYCSGTAIAQRAQALIANFPERAVFLLKLAGGDASRVRTEMVGEAFRQGDPLAAQVLRETSDLLAAWLGNIIDLIEPDVVIFGGGLSELMSCFFGHIQVQLPSRSINQRAAEIPLVRAKYGVDAGIAGGAALFQQEGMQATDRMTREGV
ncbi:MAG: ROK family protein, partial [Candidatus Korobacteraceae bacterium]